MRNLYLCMRKSLSLRAGFTLQARVNEFLKAVELIIKKEIESLKDKLSDDDNPELLNFIDNVQSILSKKIADNFLKISDDFFKIISSITQEDTTGQKVTGTRWKVTKEASCFEKEEGEMVDVTTEVKYRQLKLPDINTMQKQWLKGVSKSENILSQELQNFILNKLKEIDQIFEESFDLVLELLNRSLEQKIKDNEKGVKSSEKSILKFESQLNTIMNRFKELQDSVSYVT